MLIHSKELLMSCGKNKLKFLAQPTNKTLSGKNLITFGEPKVGDIAFVESFHSEYANTFGNVYLSAISGSLGETGSSIQTQREGVTRNHSFLHKEEINGFIFFVYNNVTNSDLGTTRVYISLKQQIGDFVIVGLVKNVGDFFNPNWKLQPITNITSDQIYTSYIHFDGTQVVATIANNPTNYIYRA